MQVDNLVPEGHGFFIGALLLLQVYGGEWVPVAAAGFEL